MSDLLKVDFENGIGTVRINRPGHRNVLSIELLEKLTELARRLQDMADLRAVILTANGPNFSAGVDLKDPRRWNLQQAGLAQRRALAYAGERMCQSWEDIPAMTICAIEGHCIGGGAALALCADFRIVGTTAYLQFPEVSLGIPLSWGALPRLVRMIGPAKTKQAVVLCEKYVGVRAVEFGLAEASVADGRAYEEARALALRIAEMPDVAAKMCKEAVNATSNALNRLASFMVRDQVALAAESAEAVAARTKFARRNKPRD